jgi:Ca2+-binding EF-hand superfamily protein
VSIFEALKRGLNNNIQKIAKEYARKNIDKDALISIYKTMTGSKPSKDEMIEIKKIFYAIDGAKNSEIALKDLIKYLNQEYGSFQYENGKGKYILVLKLV